MTFKKLSHEEKNALSPDKLEKYRLQQRKLVMQKFIDESNLMIEQFNKDQSDFYPEFYQYTMLDLDANEHLNVFDYARAINQCLKNESQQSSEYRDKIERLEKELGENNRLINKLLDSLPLKDSKTVYLPKVFTSQLMH